MRTTKLFYLLKLILLFVSYLLLAELFLNLHADQGYVALIWPSVGLATIALHRLGINLWPAVFAGAFVFNYFKLEIPILSSFSLGLGNAFEAYITVTLLQRFNFRPTLQRLKDVWILTAASFIGPAYGATVGIISFLLGEVGDPQKWHLTWMSWWLGDALGILVIAPIYFVWSTSKLKKTKASKIFELLLISVVVTCASLIVSSIWEIPVISEYSNLYLIFVIVLWTSMRFRQRAAVFVTLWITLLSVWGAIYDYGVLSDLQVHGSFFHLQVFIAVLAITGLLVSAQVTERENAEENLKLAILEAERANKVKSVFLANMSHEIRTPLGAVLGFANLLKNPNISEKERLHYLDIIVRNGDQLQNIISDILDLTKVESNILKIEKVPCSLGRTVSDVLALMKIRAEEKGILLEGPDISSLPSSVLTDPTRLKQILFNVIGNAIKFTDNGSVHIEAFIEDRGFSKDFVVKVTDSGIGIPLKEQDKLFKAFVQADDSISRKYGGSGLGLALSKRLAHLLNGDLLLVSSESNKGSTFELRLSNIQLEQGVTRIHRASEDEDTPLDGEFLAGRSILLVDDSLDNQMLISRMLTAKGALVDVANDGEAGTLKALKGNFDIVLMDISMPVLDGYSATFKLRMLGYKQPIIALTAHAMAEVKDRCLEVGCSDYLSKPIVASNLFSKILYWTRMAENERGVHANASIKHS